MCGWTWGHLSSTWRAWSLPRCRLLSCSNGSLMSHCCLPRWAWCCWSGMRRTPPWCCGCISSRPIHRVHHHHHHHHHVHHHQQQQQQQQQQEQEQRRRQEQEHGQHLKWCGRTSTAQAITTSLPREKRALTLWAGILAILRDCGSRCSLPCWKCWSRILS